MVFRPPGREEILKSIGSTRGLPEILKRSFESLADFDPIPSPKPGDWLAEHPEPGQTFDDFAAHLPHRPDPSRRIIYLQPLGQFPRDTSHPIRSLEQFAASYFAMDVNVRPIQHPEHFTSRFNHYTGKRQLLTGDILSFLNSRLPSDAFCLLAITMEDLYPQPSWNFVFGETSPYHRVGVFSFARYNPAFYGMKWTDQTQKLLLERSCRVLAHEITHMFFLGHCIYFRCLMNGSNHLQESDARPLHLCPVCLRKLQFSIAFDIPSRYSALIKFYREKDLPEEAEWASNRLKGILGHGTD